MALTVNDAAAERDDPLLRICEHLRAKGIDARVPDCGLIPFNKRIEGFEPGPTCWPAVHLTARDWRRPMNSFKFNALELQEIIEWE